jgi:4'-phosphopantetheinyl transferase EntD
VPRSGAVLAELLPPTVAAEEAFADPPELGLFPAEAAALAGAVEKRRREFAAVRRCARAALARLGEPPRPLLPGEGGAPCWPDGVVGSLTHCAGYRAAAVARASEVVTVGVDGEPHEPLPDGVLDIVAGPEEHALLDALRAACPNVRWDRVLYSAKESVYKAWYPLTRKWLDFQDVSLMIDPRAGTFAARLLKPGLRLGGAPADELSGRWLTARGLVVTAVAVPA